MDFLETVLAWLHNESRSDDVERTFQSWCVLWYIKKQHGQVNMSCFSRFSSGGVFKSEASCRTADVAGPISVQIITSHWLQNQSTTSMSSDTNTELLTGAYLKNTDTFVKRFFCIFMVSQWKLWCPGLKYFIILMWATAETWQEQILVCVQWKRMNSAWTVWWLTNVRKEVRIQPGNYPPFSSTPLKTTVCKIVHKYTINNT